jgi:hypothetical protein
MVCERLGDKTFVLGYLTVLRKIRPLDVSRYFLIYLLTGFKNDKSVMLECVKNNGCLLSVAVDEIKNDKEVVLEAVKTKGSCLEYASKRLKNDKEVVIRAVKNDWSALEYVSEDLQKDKDVLSAAAEALSLKKKKAKSKKLIKSAYIIDSSKDSKKSCIPCKVL